MKKTVLFFTIIIISANVFAQDIIEKYDDTKIEAKVIEIGLKTVKYKKFSNPDGPVYLIKKTDIRSIIYPGGERDVFDNDESSITESAPEFKQDKSMLNSLAGKGKRMYIDKSNKNAAAHAYKKLKNLGYWKITDNKNAADFIISFDIDYQWESSSGIAVFIHPKKNQIFYKTGRCFADLKDDFNLKRGIIHKIIEEELVPLTIK